MSKLALTITQAGHSRFTAAQVDEDIDLSISAVGLSDRAFVAAPTLTALPGEFRRVSTISGEAVGDNVVHMVVRDAEPLAYTVRGFGLFLADGTLFATYAQDDALFEKSALSDMHLAIDIAFPTGNVEQLTFGDTNFLNPPATTEVKGVAALASQEQVDAGEDGERIVTPRTLAQRLAAALAGITAALDLRALASRKVSAAGLATGGGDLTDDRTITVPAATVEQLLAATAADVAVTPAAFGGLARSLGAKGYWTLPGGLIVQWVNYRASLADEPAVTVAYPLAFPNACLVATATAFIDAPANNRNSWPQIAGEPGKASCVVQLQADDQNDRLVNGFNLLLIGY